MSRAWRAVNLFALLLAPAAGLWEQGTLPQEPYFSEYAGKFCFDYAPWVERTTASGKQEIEKPTIGIFNVTVHGFIEKGRSDRTTQDRPCVGKCPMAGRLFLMSFDDEGVHWLRARARWNELSCQELHGMASYVHDLTSAGNMDRGVNVLVREHLRPRFWYWAFVNCGATVRSPLTYTLHANNVRQDFQAEFGVDFFGCLHLEVAFGLVFALLALTAFRSSSARGRGFGTNTVRRRPLLQLLQASALFSAISCASVALHYGVYAADGRGLVLVGVFSALCASLARAMLMVLQFFLAKGWAFVLLPSEWPQRHFVTATLACIAVLTVGCEIHGEYFRDQSTSLHLYQTWSGLLILGLNLCLLAAAWFLIWSAYQKERSAEVRSFYRSVFLASGVYFASLPAICLLAAQEEPWWRRKVIEGVELAARCSATALLFFCLRPSRIDLLIDLRLGDGLKDPEEGGETEQDEDKALTLVE